MNCDPHIPGPRLYGVVISLGAVMVEGEMEVRLGEEIHVLKPGDSIYYDSTVPHLVKCHGKETTKILAVLNTGK